MSDTSGALTDIPELQFAELVAAARARLPALCPGWTDHGPADVGVTLIELFAWLTEMIRYRTRRETEATTRALLELLAGPELARDPDLALATRRALAELWTPYRAVTPDDYEALARDAWPRSPEAAALARSPILHRVRCLPERDLEGPDPLAPAPGHVSLVVQPADALPVDDAMRAALHRFFEPRRLLTTRHHVVGPRPLTVRVDASIHLDDDVACVTPSRAGSTRSSAAPTATAGRSAPRSSCPTSTACSTPSTASTSSPTSSPSPPRLAARSSARTARRSACASTRTSRSGSTSRARGCVYTSRPATAGRR